MHSPNTSQAVLRALYELARDDRRAHIASVARLLRISCREVDAALQRLEATNLVDATRVRLTMSGLVVAAGLPQLRKTQLSNTRVDERAA